MTADPGTTDGVHDDAHDDGVHLPVSVVVSRRPAPGREADLERWARGIVAAASGFPGHLGAQVYPASPPDRDDLVIAFSFTDAHSLSDWEHSEVRRDWLARSAALVAGPSQAHSVSGFESLFRAVGEPAGTPAPPRWKTALVIALALFPASLLLNWLVTPHLTAWPLPARILLSTVVIVPWMVWGGVPWLSRLLRPWLRGH
ncbi:antibiotic biosynthesis monooxygenase [Kineosporia sp. A_224]|uniref:antibiotic biosynthesis monooxygenase n=1 Tax=Kineosporia sp. A_224 TaxID=1962180 RepID=UPI000B4A9663|nr:antibiotic biosynthesis monooxygenase [Kineosporia sp. A_224]